VEGPADRDGAGHGGIGALSDGWRLALGTLTAIPVAPPRLVDRRRAQVAMLVAPLAAVPLGVVAAIILELARLAGLPSLLGGVLAVGALALGTRVMHWDGLSDVADGLTASYDAARSLAVMKTGTSGPAGTVAVVLVAGAQAAALAGLPATLTGAVLAGAAVCVGRAALAVCCLRGVPSARPDGLGAAFAGTVPRVAAMVVWLVLAAALAAVATLAGLPWWRGLVAAGIALVVLGALVQRVTRRFGGVTGDVFGAGVELASAALLVALA